MRRKSSILVTTLLFMLSIGTMSLWGCGQKGNLTLPNDPDFKQRATLPDILKRQLPLSSSSPQAPDVASGASSVLPASPAASQASGH